MRLLHFGVWPVVIFASLCPAALGQTTGNVGHTPAPVVRRTDRSVGAADFPGPPQEQSQQPAEPEAERESPSEPDSDDDEDTVEERLSKLETQFKERADEEAKETAWPPKSPTLEIDGRIHFDHWSFTDDSEGIHFFENPGTGVDPEDRDFFRRLRLGFAGEIYPNMLYTMEMDFNRPSEPEMKDVYIGFEELPLLQTVLIGNQKRPLGLDHLNSSRFNIFIERPLVVEAFNEDARRLGVASYGVSDDELYNWRYGVYLLENPVTSGRIIGDSRQASLNGRLASAPWYDETSGGRGYFHWALIGMLARPDGDASPFDTNPNLGRFRTRGEIRSDRRWIDTGPVPGAQWYEIAGVESMLNIGALHIVGEYQTAWMQRDDTTPGTGPDLFFHGAYVHVAYMLTGEHVPYRRRRGIIDRVRPFENFFLVERCRGGAGSGWGAWQVAARFSYLDLSDRDIRGGVEHNVALALVWYLNSHASLQFNAVYGDISEHRPAGGFTGGHFTALGTRLRVDF